MPYFASGGTRQLHGADTLPAASTADTSASPLSLICTIPPPIDFAVGLAPGAWVILTSSPLRNRS